MKHRSIRVGQQIKEIVSEIIQRDLREKVKFFSIPHVKVSDDSSFARIYISFFEVNSEREFEKIRSVTTESRNSEGKGGGGGDSCGWRRGGGRKK